MDTSIIFFIEQNIELYIKKYRFAKNFIDIREREQNNDINGRVQGRSLMNVHNNEAGRRVIFDMPLN